MAAIDNITLQFGWRGPQCVGQGGLNGERREVRTVNFLFQNTRWDTIVLIPSQILLNNLQQVQFARVEGGGRFMKNYPSLDVSVKKMQNLKLTACFFQNNPNKSVEGSLGKTEEELNMPYTDSIIELKMPSSLVIGKTYSIIVTSKDLSLTADLIEGEIESLISKDMQSTNSIISVPTNKSADSSPDLSQFSVQELKDYFVQATLKDRKLEIARLKADLAGDKEKVKQGLSEEYANTQWIMALRGALASKRADRVDLNSTALKLIQSKEFKLIESELIDLQRQVLARQQKRKA